MPNDVNEAISDYAKEHESVYDTVMKEEMDLWDKQVDAIKTRVKLEYELKKQGAAELLKYTQQLQEVQDKKNKTKDKKQLQELQKQEDKIREQSTKAQLDLREKQAKKLAEVEAKARQKAEIDANKQIYKDRIAAIQEEMDLYGKTMGRSLKLAMAEESARVNSMGGFGKALGESLAQAATKAFSHFADAGVQSINNAMSLFQGKASAINTRLQGTSKTFNAMNELFEKELGASPYVKYEDAIDNLATLVDMGISYNVEQRAFLETISDKIATTFDAHSSAMLQIIRLQREDSTIYRLGAEAELTKYFNERFQDSSYMSDLYDTVSQTILGGVSQLGTAGGAEYEYNLQKWFGSLYSLGMSSNTITSLASAINMLSTGDVSGVAGSGLQNLLVMAANKGNLSYGELLKQGVNAQNVDALMSNIVSYWSQLATTNNQVVKQQLGSLFGLGMSDMMAIRNLTQEDVNSILGEQFAYSDAEKVLQQQLGQVSNRMHISELIQNAYNNVVTGIGTSIASNTGLATTFLINNMIKEATGGINIPFVSALGSGIDLNTDLNSLINLGIVGAGTYSSIKNVFDSISNRGGLDLSSWQATKRMDSRGQGLSGIVTGIQQTTSQTTTIANASGQDIYDLSLNDAYQNVDKSVVGKAPEEAEQLQKAIKESIDPNIQAILDLLRSVTDGSALRVSVSNYGLTSSF